ncbi:hypothetical protein AX17_002633 [Amanita inopinata Kibby_2008]|nr:hypothetical protein AX17_002633 [Amanita inopinata Kibby_2008]
MSFNMLNLVSYEALLFSPVYEARQLNEDEFMYEPGTYDIDLKILLDDCNPAVKALYGISNSPSEAEAGLVQYTSQAFAFGLQDNPLSPISGSDCPYTAAPTESYLQRNATSMPTGNAHYYASTSTSIPRSSTIIGKKRKRTPSPPIASGGSGILSQNPAAWSSPENQQNGVAICRWDGCNRVMEGYNGTPRSISNVLANNHAHIPDLGVAGDNLISCRWIKNGRPCNAIVQVLNMTRHVADHLRAQAVECRFCGGSQLRRSNMARHYSTCTVVTGLDEAAQRRAWSEVSKKPFSTFEESQRKRERLSSSRATRAKTENSTS